MSATPEAGSDERTVAVENASYRWGWLLLYLGVWHDACLFRSHAVFTVRLCVVSSLVTAWV